MLYGESGTNGNPAKDEMSRSAAPNTSEGSSGKAEPSHWCVIIRDNGIMEVCMFFFGWPRDFIS